MDCSDNDLFEALFHPWRSAGQLCPKEKPASANRRTSPVNHVICLCHGHCSYWISSHSKYTAWCPLPEASDVARRSHVDWGFRCRLRPSRLDLGKTEARHEKSSWRLSISGRHAARRAARVSGCPGMRQFATHAHRLSDNVDHLRLKLLTNFLPALRPVPLRRPAICGAVRQRGAALTVRHGPSVSPSSRRGRRSTATKPCRNGCRGTKRRCEPV
jgi:hypothetical protein